MPDVGVVYRPNTKLVENKTLHNYAVKKNYSQPCAVQPYNVLIISKVAFSYRYSFSLGNAQKFLKFKLICHPPYWSDLSQSNFYLFPKLK